MLPWSSLWFAPDVTTQTIPFSEEAIVDQALGVDSPFPVAIVTQVAENGDRLTGKIVSLFF